ncbi:hypothetical protein NPIL_34041 [Nephila pilipes]|uniref:Uncharacterized protein n=1 Tax=Nephila pilipes TaxID=299642 RepID=A0A8X6P533_NEPPI|nr:hypothetical protein NPIL_34041 [Nephila pilipes]
MAIYCRIKTTTNNNPNSGLRPLYTSSKSTSQHISPLNIYLGKKLFFLFMDGTNHRPVKSFYEAIKAGLNRSQPKVVRERSEEKEKSAPRI